MEVGKTVLDVLWQINAITGKQLIAIKTFDDIKVYIVMSFSPKTRDVFFNEVRDAIDITDLVENAHFQFSPNNPINIDDRIMQRPLKSFKFGHDNYIWLISNMGK